MLAGFNNFYLPQRTYIVTSVYLSVCPSVCLLTEFLKNTDQIGLCIKIYGMVGHNPVTNRLHFE